MKRLRVEFTVEELTLLAALASDQLFRREFIDPKMPGYKGDAEEVRAGKSLVARLRAIAGQTLHPSAGPAMGGWTSGAVRPNGSPDAL